MIGQLKRHNLNKIELNREPEIAGFVIQTLKCVYL